MTKAALSLGMLVLLCACSQPEDTLELCTGDYSFDEVDEWFHQLGPRVMSIPGVYSIDADERYNCVMVGIRDGDVKPQVRAEALAVGVPADAVGFEITEPYEVSGP